MRGSALAPVLETALDAVIVMDTSGEVCGWNDQAEKVFGWSRAEALGRRLVDLIIPPRHRQAHVEGLARMLEGGEGRILGRRLELTALHQTGREFPVELAVTRTQDAGRAVFLGFLRDISGRKLAEENLERRARHAELLFRVTQTASETGSLEHALRACLEAICEIADWSLGHAFVVDEAEVLRPSMIWHPVGPDRFEAFRNATREIQFEHGVGLPGRILQTREPAWVTDVRSEEAFVRAEAARRAGLAAAFGFPILSGGRVLAVLEFFSEAKAEPDPELLLTVRTISVQTGRVFDRRRAEDELRRQEEQLRLLADALPLFVSFVDRDERYQLVSRSYEDWFGRPRDEIVGRSIREVLGDEAYALRKPYIEAALRGEASHFDTVTRRADGTWRDSEMQYLPRRDAEGRVDGFYVVGSDVSERKAAERALRESEERLRIALAAGRMAVWDFDIASDRLTASPELYRLLGYPQGTTPSTDEIRQGYPEGERERMRLELERSQTRGEPYAEIEFRYVRPDGALRWLMLRAEVQLGGDRAPERIVGVLLDVTGRKQMELALRAANERLEEEVTQRIQERNQIWSLSQDLFAVMGFDGYLKTVNPAWSRILGFDEHTLLATHFADLVHPDDHPAVRQMVERLQGGEIIQHFEDRIRAADGGYRWIAWTVVPDTETFYAVGRDVTEEKAREEQQRQSSKMEAVGQLTGGIAHDFNNLLQVVMGNLEILDRNLPPDAARLRRAAGNAMAGARRAASLTQRLLAFSRRQPLEPKPLDVNRLVGGMSDLLTRSLGETIELETVLAAGLWRVEADANQLEAAILNLAINARDAMPEGGKLTIETANASIDGAYAEQHLEVTPGQYVMICVSDTGEGMDRSTLARAFEPFFTTKDVGHGTGLGLSQVYGFVKQSSGHVKIYSEPGAGATVKIYLPRLVRAIEEEEAPREEQPPEGSGLETVLVVEDDPDVRSYSVESLRELGYRVLEAPDGPSALRVLAREGGGVDLLFTDVVLPEGMTGRDLAEAARRIEPALKVLFTTGYARNAIVHQGRLDPGVHLISKPFTFGELAGRVRDVLDSSD